MQSQAHWKPAPHLADLYREGGKAEVQGRGALSQAWVP